MKLLKALGYVVAIGLLVAGVSLASGFFWLWALGGALTF